MKNVFSKLVVDEKGQDLIEYALMAGFVAVAAAAIMPAVSEGLFAATKLLSPPAIRIACTALAVLFLGVIVLRRRPDNHEE